MGCVCSSNRDEQECAQDLNEDIFWKTAIWDTEGQ
jgi:hypothetical protein